mmetsp:Transcript_10598/g.17688  ORF Transcript_10598/g.17688 Transcript_10598/m.17688 type:complete len:155 (+) Transcript_10598:53-517(+)
MFTLITLLLASVMLCVAVGPQPMHYATSKEKLERLSSLRDWIPRWEKQIENLRANKHLMVKNEGVPDNLSAAKLRKLTVQLEKARLEMKGFDPNSPELDSRTQKKNDGKDRIVARLEHELSLLSTQMETASDDKKSLLQARFDVLKKSLLEMEN